jgi:hypothetical protein
MKYNEDAVWFSKSSKENTVEPHFYIFEGAV